MKSVTQVQTAWLLVVEAAIYWFGRHLNSTKIESESVFRGHVRNHPSICQIEAFSISLIKIETYFRMFEQFLSRQLRPYFRVRSEN